MIEVMNGRHLKTAHPAIVWVDRRSVLGNPFVMKAESEREGSIRNYRAWLWSQIKTGNVPVVRELKRLLELEKQLGHIRLACWCSPKPCHADVLVAALEWMKK